MNEPPLKPGPQLVFQPTTGSSKRAISPPILWLDEVDSTNDLCLKEGLASGKSFFSLAAKRQRKGRGRRGRPWESLDGENLYLSVFYKTSLSPLELGGLTLHLGLFIGRALEDLIPLQLAWPNDLYVKGKKLGGVLSELHDFGGSYALVVGIGINLSARSFGGELQKTATSLALEMASPPSLPSLAEKVNQALFLGLTSFDGHLDVKAWQERAVRESLPGARLMDLDSKKRGTLRGMLEDGSLLMKWDGEEKESPFLAGTLRPI